MENITENNKLIAEFLRFQQTNIGWYDAEEVLLKTEKDNTFDNLKFHSDWNWLKLVLEKISYLNKDNFSDETKQVLKDLLSLNLFSSKENVYESITNFIKTIK